MRSSAYLAWLAAGMAALVLSTGALLDPAQAAGSALFGAGVVPSAAFEPSGHERHLDEDDEIAALEAIRVALTEVGDGSSYVWHRRSGHLSGLVQPTQSFKDPAGRVCRQLIVILSARQRSGRFEGTACRLTSGRWQLEG
jgi:surface antigen